jgi:tetratricopeptide (TPR) repeat protein
VFTGNAERYLQSVPNDNDRDFFFFQSFYRNNYNPELEFTQALQAQLSFSSDISNYMRWNKNLEASLLNEQANLLMATGKFYAASELLREAVSIKPNNIKLQQKLVSCLEKLN